MSYYNINIPSFQELGLEVYDIIYDTINGIKILKLKVKKIKNDDELFCEMCVAAQKFIKKELM